MHTFRRNAAWNQLGRRLRNGENIVLTARIHRQMNIKSGTKILLSRDEKRIIPQPVVSLTDELAGLTAQKLGKSAKEMGKYYNGERKEGQR